MGYMPVITNLASSLFDYASREDGDTRFKAFIIAPLAIFLKQQGEDVKIVYFGNRHESTFVARKGLNAKSLRDLSGRKMTVPMRYSGHNLSLLNQIEEERLVGSIEIVEMNPPDMASALRAGSLDAYWVGEPFAAQTLSSGHLELVS